MTTPITVGIAWYRPEEYKTLMAMFEDGADYPNNFEEWEVIANRGLQDLVSQGLRYEKAILGPETFPAFCRQWNMKMDRMARTAFAANYVRMLDRRGVLAPCTKN